MPKHQILIPGNNYTFSTYFDLPYEAEDILAEFDYSLLRKHLSFSHSEHLNASLVSTLAMRIEEILPLVSLSSEAARRELLISPVLIELVRETKAKLAIEYPLNINNYLKGNLDYFLRLNNNLLIIEAKKGDLDKGFVQLAVELIAMDVWMEDPTPLILGAVSTGSIWQFALLQRKDKIITQDLTLFRVPADLLLLFNILVAALMNNGQPICN